MRPDILTVPVELPNLFSMSLRSAYGKLCRLAFYEHPEIIESALPILHTLAEHGQKLPDLCEEEILFHCQEQTICFRQNLAGHNLLLGAVREIGEFSHGYEPEVSCAISVLTPPDALLLDIGASWGPVALQAALRPGFSGKVHCFEPQPAAIAMLTGFIERLGLAQTVIAHDFALSDRAGQLEFCTTTWAGDTHVAGANADKRDGFTCRAERLDDVLPQVRPHLIKLDVNGHARQVLAGAGCTLEQSRPLVIFEDQSHGDKAVYEMLLAHDYQFYAIGWYNPYEDSFNTKPIRNWPVQLLAFRQFDLSDLSELSDCRHVLASPDVLQA